MSSRRQALQALQNPGSHPNVGLWLDKYPRSLDRSNPEAFNATFEEGAHFSKGSASQTYQLVFKRWKQSLESLGALVSEATTRSRVVVGLGNESPLETSITLDRTHGVPILPGSALKGLAASFARNELEGWEIESPAYQLLFGCQTDTEEKAGCVNFHDAWPEPRAEKFLYQDVINVHHPDYYQKEPEHVQAPPADWDSPVPLGFLSCSARFWVALSGESNEWIVAAHDILAMALKEYGVGAKTTRGYGRLELKRPPNASKTASEGASDLQKQLEALGRLQPRDKGNFQTLHIDPWKKFSNLAQKQEYGKAILQKLRELGWYKGWADKEWLKRIEAECGNE